MAPSIQGSTTTVRPGAVTTTTARPTTTSVRPATTTQAPSTTVDPNDPQPPIVIDIVPPEDGFEKQSVVVELLVSTGAQTETVFLNVDLRNFSVDVPQQVVVLPATGVQATGNSGVFAQALAGLGALIAGALLLLVGRSRRQSH